MKWNWNFGKASIAAFAISLLSTNSTVAGQPDVTPPPVEGGIGCINFATAQVCARILVNTDADGRVTGYQIAPRSPENLKTDGLFRLTSPSLRLQP